MFTFLAIVLAALAAHFVNGWLEPHVADVSIRAMIALIVFIAVYIVSSRYFKNLWD
jgi:hypothetical protein